MPSVAWMTPWPSSGTSYQRCHLPARLLREHAGWDTFVGDEIMWLSEEDGGGIAVGTGGEGFRPDVLVISWWAPEQHNVAEVLTDARNAGQRIILDADDNPWCHRGFANPDWIEIVRNVDEAWVTTPALADQLRPRFGRLPVKVVPTLYDPSPYEPWPCTPSWGALRGLPVDWRRRGERGEDGLTLLGYRGGLQWHARDVAELRRLREWPFVHIGHDPRQWFCSRCKRYSDALAIQQGDTPECPRCRGEMIRARFAVADVDGRSSTRLEELAGVSVVRRFQVHAYRRYAQCLANVAPYVTLGVIPLEETKFSEAKTCIGGWEWTAVGVPWIATETAEYRKAAGTLTGCSIVRKPRDWALKVRNLLEEPDVRQAVLESQTAAAEAWHCEKRWDIWEGALADAV